MKDNINLNDYVSIRRDDIKFFGNGCCENVHYKQSHPANAHLFYKGKSVIVDYEYSLHTYSKSELWNPDEVFVEIYPVFGGFWDNERTEMIQDIKLFSVKRGKNGNIDMEDLTLQLENAIEEEKRVIIRCGLHIDTLKI